MQLGCAAVESLYQSILIQISTLSLKYKMWILLVAAAIVARCWCRTADGWDWGRLALTRGTFCLSHTTIIQHFLPIPTYFMGSHTRGTMHIHVARRPHGTWIGTLTGGGALYVANQVKVQVVLRSLYIFSSQGEGRGATGAGLTFPA